MKPFFRKESFTKETRLFLLRKNENLKNYLIFRLSDHVSIYILISFY